MFGANEEDCVFIETAKNVQKNIHMSVECIPLPRDQGDLAPIYFKVRNLPNFQSFYTVNVSASP